ncbi:hypothetical protein P3F83_15130 [Mycobacteroides immunogenum]|uniref:hypothetical protein n=1 Tax=Mycobacteroides immunogenum TaxID=83262 RepID=UPI0025B750C6|nr:hypothetical protein [Mycobacteroides immunogenum]WJR31903.1 hypothetical protein P3F83_15130 [Mycobacteroides immunogenum]
MLRVNALDYFLEVPGRTWEQFLEFFDDMCRRQGTALWSRAATDPALLASVDDMTEDQINKILERSEIEPHHRYTPEVREMRNICDRLISLTAVMGHAPQSSVKYMPRPDMIGDLIRERATDYSHMHLDATLLAAQRNYQDQIANGGIDDRL